MERTWRIDAHTYAQKANELRKKGTSVEDWAKISLSSDTSNDERMLRCMMDNETEKDADTYICIAYLSQNSLPQEFVEDLIYVNSGLALMGCWNKDVINWVLDLYDDHIPTDSSRSYGNVIEHVVKAYESNKFKKSCPEYHNHLGKLIKESRYYDLKDMIKDFQITATDIDEIQNQVMKMADIVIRFRKCKIYVRNRIDWMALPIEGLDLDFYRKFKRSNKIISNASKLDDLVED